MRRVWLGMFGVLAAVCVGCLSQSHSRTMSWLDRLRPFNGPSGPDAVFLNVATLERPAGDDYLDREIWTGVDAQVIEAESKAVLDDNGLRIGLVSGLMPERLATLLDSKKANLGTRHYETRADTPVLLPQGPEWPQATADVQQDGRTLPVEYEHAQCALQATVALLGDGRVRVRFVPQIQHGERRLWPQMPLTGAATPAAGDRPTVLYDALGWEVALGPNEFLVVGSRSARRTSLGGLFFLGAGPAVNTQRLLVIRAGRLNPAPAPAVAVPTGGAPPLAMQASVSTIRSCGP